MRTFLILLINLSLAACVSNPLKLEGVNPNVTPALVNTKPAGYTGVRVAWGGMIVRTQPLPQMTQIEVLAYPLDDYGQPQSQAPSQGRFLIMNQGYLEPADYAPGRWLSVVGRIGKSQSGKVGEATYEFPVLNPEQLHLWPAGSGSDGGSDSRTNFHFGIGIQIH